MSVHLFLVIVYMSTVQWYQFFYRGNQKKSRKSKNWKKGQQLVLKCINVASVHIYRIQLPKIHIKIWVIQCSLQENKGNYSVRYFCATLLPVLVGTFKAIMMNGLILILFSFVSLLSRSYKLHSGDILEFRWCLGLMPTNDCIIVLTIYTIVLFLRLSMLLSLWLS